MPGLITFCIAYVFSQFFRSFLAVLTPVLSDDLTMTATQFAHASGAWFVAFAMMQFPVGILLDSIGPRRTAGYIFTIFTGSGALMFAWAHSPLIIILVLIICVALAFHIPQTPWIGTATYAVIGFISASYAVQMAHGKAFVPAHLTGRGVTLLNFCSIGSAGFFQWIAGPVVEFGTVATDPQSGYRTLFIYYSILIAAAILPYWFAKDAKPNSN